MFIATLSRRVRSPFTKYCAEAGATERGIVCVSPWALALTLTHHAREHNPSVVKRKTLFFLFFSGTLIKEQINLRFRRFYDGALFVRIEVSLCVDDGFNEPTFLHSTESQR